MSEQHTYIDYLNEILHTIEKATTFVEGMSFDAFNQDEKTVYAVIRALEVVGEASKKIPKDIKDRYEEIPWRELAGMRDKLIHDYIGVNMMVVWKAISEDLPQLKPLLQKMLADIQ